MVTVSHAQLMQSMLMSTHAIALHLQWNGLTGQMYANVFIVTTLKQMAQMAFVVPALPMLALTVIIYHFVIVLHQQPL